MANPARPAERKTAAEEALLLIKQARKRGMHVPAKEVECANGGEFCGLASCHICREMLHHHAVEALFQRYDTSSGVQWATITPAYGRVELDDWREFDPEAFLKKIRRQLRNTMPPWHGSLRRTRRFGKQPYESQSSPSVSCACLYLSPAR